MYFLPSLVRIPVSLIFLFAFGLFYSCKDSDQLAQEALHHLKSGKSITALALFDQILDEEPENPLALYGRGKILISNSLTINIGKRILKKALFLLDSEEEAKKDIYITLSHVLKAKESILFLEKAIQREKKLFPEIYQILAQRYLEKGESQKALDTYEKAIHLYPNHIQLVVEYALFLNQKGKYKKTDELLVKASDKNPEKLDYLSSLVLKPSFKKILDF